MSFTGTRDLPTAAQWKHIRGDLALLGGATGFVTGGCTGIDAMVGHALFQMYPEAEHTVVVPADRSRIKAWWRPVLDLGQYVSHLTVIDMRPDTTYRDRNIRMVNVSDVLIGYPQYGERHPRSIRSGSWQTVRMARRLHKVRPIVTPLEAM